MPFTDTERWPRSAVAFAIADGWQKIRRADDKLAAHAACSTLVNELGARLCRRQQWQRATAAAANVQQSCTLAAAVFACLWAGALERVQRQRSRADACVIVSQPRQARKRQKRAEAAAARRSSGQIVFSDRLPPNRVKNGAF